MSDPIAIYTYGGGEALEAVFNGIAAITSGDSLHSMIKIAASLGLLWSVVITLIRGTLSESGKWFFWFMLSITVFVVPTGTIWIKDEISNKAYKVDNVPLVLGKTASIFSTIGNQLTKKIEQNFSVVDDIKYHKSGTVFASRLVGLAGHFKIVDSNFKENMGNFVNRCIVYDAMIGHKYTIEDLRRSNDIWGLVSGKASNLLGMMYRYPKNNNGAVKESEIITCKAVATLMSRQWSEQLKKASLKYGSQIGTNLNVDLKRDFMSRLQGTFGYLTGISEGANEILRQEMMINAIDEASHNKVNELGGNTNYATTKALLQQKSTYQITGELAGKLLPSMKIVFEALAYGAFLIVLMLALFPSGWKVLTSYVSILLWVQMWPPLYAILNLLMNIYAKNETQGIMGGEGLSIITSIGISEVNIGIESLAGYLSMSIPFISYAIVKGGAASFIHLAGHLGSAVQSAASHSASEVTAGNISLGNYSQGIKSYNNTSAFQQTTSGSYSSGQNRMMTDHGESYIAQADGSIVMVGGAGQTISVSSSHLSLGNSLSKQASDSLSKSQSLLSSRSKEVSSAESETFRNMVDLGSRTMEGRSSGESYSLTNSSGERTAFSNTLDFANSLQQKKGWSSRQSMEAALGVSVGGSVGGRSKLLKGFLEGTLKGNFSSYAARDQALDEAKDLAQREGYSENLESVLTSAKDMRFGTNQSEERSLSEGLSGSMERMQTARTAESDVLQDINNWNNTVQQIKSESVNSNQNLDQEFFDFIAESKDISGQHKLGHRDAYEVWQGQGHNLHIRKELESKFLESKLSNVYEKVAQEDMSQSFESRASNLQRGDIAAMDQVRQKASSSGLSNSSVDTTAMDQVTSNIDKTGKRMDQQKIHTEEKKSRMEYVANKEKKKTMAGRVIKQPAKNAYELYKAIID